MSNGPNKIGNRLKLTVIGGIFLLAGVVLVSYIPTHNSLRATVAYTPQEATVAASVSPPHEFNSEGRMVILNSDFSHNMIGINTSHPEDYYIDGTRFDNNVEAIHDGH